MVDSNGATAGEDKPTEETTFPILKSENGQVREHLVETAVKFLTSPKVVSYDEQSKTTFLEKKGLSKEEIDCAFSRVKNHIPVTNTYAQQPNIDTSPQYQIIPVPHMQPPSVLPRQSFWAFLRDTSSFVIFLSGIAYGFHYLYKHYIGPYLTGQRPKSGDEALLEVQHSIMKVLQQIQVTLDKLDLNITEHNEILLGLAAPENIIKKVKFQGIDDIQAEIKTIKGLLINKNSFPAPPAAAPVIPQWQRLSKVSEEPSTQITMTEDAQGIENGNLSEMSCKSDKSEDSDVL